MQPSNWTCSFVLLPTWHDGMHALHMRRSNGHPGTHLMSGLRANSGLSNWLGAVNMRVLVVSCPPRWRSGDSMVWFLVSLQAHG
jgi:hypothetical protein